MADATRNQPITVQVISDQIDTDHFELFLNDGLIAIQPIDPAGVNFPFPDGFAPGTYRFRVDAVGPRGTVPSDPVDLVVAPGLPSQPRLVIVVG